MKVLATFIVSHHTFSFLPQNDRPSQPSCRFRRSCPVPQYNQHVSLRARSKELLNAEINGTNQRKETLRKRNKIPPSVYELNPLPDDRKTTIFNPEMIPYDYLRSTRLLEGRSYARNTAFHKDNMNELPNLQDLSSPSESNDILNDKLWSTTGFRFGVFLGAFLAFPKIVIFLRFQETIPLSEFDQLTGSFSTGVSILYGTLISLTLSILYERQKCISDQVATESALLVMLTRNLLSIFKNDKDGKIAAGECIADQVQILVKESRGKELMTMIYADPYGRILDLLNAKTNDPEVVQLMDNTRGVIKDSFTSRSKRLAGESSGLPPTHFFILTLLTVIILLSYTLSTFPTIDVDGTPSIESRFFFAAFVAVYVLFFNFSRDLNNPFGGVYQIRRSAIAANLLQTKWLLVNDPDLAGRVDFDDDEIPNENNELM